MPNTQFEARRTAFSAGRVAIIADDAGSSPRAVLTSQAQGMTPAIMNRLLQFGGGLPFVALPPERVNAFLLEQMARPRSSSSNSDSSSNLKVCLSVEAREGVQSGISAADRAVTVAVLGEAVPNPRKLVKPGHIFPVETRAGGVLIKAALPEAALDLVRICGHTEAAFFVELLDRRGEYISAAELQQIASTNNIPIFLLSEIVRHRLRTESLVERVAEAKLPTVSAGELRSIIYRSKIHGGEHVALVKGDISSGKPVLTRVQPEFTFSDVFGGSHPPSRLTLRRSLEAIGQRGAGVLLYLRRTSQGELQDQLTADDRALQNKTGALMREYGLGAQILRDLGVTKIELLSSSNRSLAGLDTFGIEITAQHPIPNL